MIIVIRTVIITIIASDVFLPYYWGGDNVWKCLLLSHKKHQDHYVNLGLQ